MCSKVHKRGFTLIQTLLVLLVVPVLLVISVLMLKVMINSKVPTMDSLEIASFQLAELIVHSGKQCIKDNQLYLKHNNQKFNIIQHSGRIVKTPGYDILLEGVRDFEISREVIKMCTDKCFFLEGGIHFTLGSYDDDLCIVLDTD